MARRRRAAAGQHAGSRRRLGLVLRLWRAILARHDGAVVHGLQVAGGNDHNIPHEILERGIAWLRSYQPRQARLRADGAPDETVQEDCRRHGRARVQGPDRGRVRNDEMLDFLYRDRVHLSVYGKALDRAGAWALGDRARLPRCCKTFANMSCGMTRIRPPGSTCPTRNSWWILVWQRPRDGCFDLEAAGPHRAPRRPVPRLVKYVLNNRRHADTGVRPATRPPASKCWPSI